MAEFADLVAIIRGLTDRTITAGVASGNVHIDTADTLAALHACESDSANTGLTLVTPDSITSVEIGSDVDIEIRTPRPGFGLIPENLDGLLRFPGAHVTEPARYYLLDTNYQMSDEAPAGHVVRSYRTVLQFIAMLKGCAAFLDEREEVLIFIKEGKFEVPVSFAQSDLGAMNIDDISALTIAIPPGVHEKQCASIMAEAVYELTAKLPLSKRFAALLEHAKELKERFEKGYKLFAAGFSYEKIRDEIEAARVEYSGKIHKVFSDIQNQLLGIPVATIIVATQMKANKEVGAEFWTSLAVLLGSFIFMLLMHFLLRNQRQTLEVIGIEIMRQKTKLEKEHAAIASNFMDTFRSLDSRYRGQRRILRVVDGVVVVGFLLSLYFFYKLSTPAQQWVSGVVKCLN